MTPTLFGRWQTRTLLLLTFGLFFTLPFMLFFGLTPLINLLLVLFLGYGWDVAYILIQSRRWDRDWPPAYQALAGLWEALFTFGLGWLLGRRLGIFETPFLVFFFHYGLVWWSTFFASQSLLRIVFPNWRYRGGQWLF